MICATKTRFTWQKRPLPLDLLSNGRVALGVSRGSPEAAERGWEPFGYTGSTDPRGADIAHQHFDTFLRAVRGEPMSTAAEDQYPAMYRPGAGLPVMPQSPGLDRRIWWGAGRRETAEWAAEQGVNLMSSTLLTEATGEAFADLQAQQLQHYHEAWKRAGHDWTPRVSVSRTIFPIIDGYDRKLYLGANPKTELALSMALMQPLERPMQPSQTNSSSNCVMTQP